MSAMLKTIPLCQLKPSPKNVRKTYRRSHIETMARDIARRGLLENLVVYPAPEGRHPAFEVDAGGLRLAGLQLLAKQRKIAKDHPVPCHVLGKDANRTEVSLAENAVRLALHPADEFEAFARLISEGQSIPEVAAAFRVTGAFVKQRMKLAAVSPRLVKAFRDAKMTLEQLEAFTLSDDHAVQEQLWFGQPYATLPAHYIRQALTEAKVRSSDPRARFVGLKAYEARGGTILRDLFDKEDEGYLADSVLLEAMVAEKLEASAQELRTEGWQWVEVHPMLSWNQLAAFGRAETVVAPLSKSDTKQLAIRQKQRQALIAQLGDEEDEEGLEQLEALEADIALLEAKARTWTDTEKARSGAIVSIDHEGAHVIERGLVREAAVERRKPKEDGARPESSGYARALVSDLSLVRTAALRSALCEQPHWAFIAILYALAGTLLYRERVPHCLGITANETLIDGKIVEGSKAVLAFQERHASWLERLPEREALWPWLMQLDQNDRMNLLAHCIALTVDARDEPSGSAARTMAADMLASALDLDINAWWRPTGENYFSRLSKAEIMAALSETLPPDKTQRLEKLKKQSMAAEAERLLSKSSWLPRALRRKDTKGDEHS